MYYYYLVSDPGHLALGTDKKKLRPFTLFSIGKIFVVLQVNSRINYLTNSFKIVNYNSS